MKRCPANDEQRYGVENQLDEKDQRLEVAKSEKPGTDGQHGGMLWTPREEHRISFSKQRSCNNTGDKKQLSW